MFTWDISALDPSIRPWLARAIPFNGPFAVWVFFLVSGFSLSIGFIESRDRSLLLRFATGRYVRLTVPVFAACALVHLAIVGGLMNVGPERHASYKAMFNFEITLGHLFQFALFDVYFRYEHANSYLGVLWTMSFELIGSYVLLFVLFFSPIRPMAFCLFLAIILIAVFGLSSDVMAIYVPLFFIGALLAQAFAAGWLAKLPQAISLAALVLGCAAPLFLSTQSLPSPLVVWGVSALFVGGCIATTSVRAFLSNSLSRYLGTISFPLYLVHGPMLHLIGEPALRAYGYSTTLALGLNLAIICFSFAFAHLLLPVDQWAQKTARAIGFRAVSAIPGRRAEARQV